MYKNSWHRLLGAVVLLGGSACAWGEIYTCVDAKGRKLTSDRPIPSCVDREQTMLNPSGSVKTRVGPTLTGVEKAELEQREKKRQEEQSVVDEEKRRNRALLTRYPNQALHDKDRADALAQIDEVVRAALTRQKELTEQSKAMVAELEFYKGDPSKAPASVRRKIEQNKQDQTAQQRFLSDKEEEKRRVNVRFDDELIRLRQLWTARGG